MSGSKNTTLVLGAGISGLAAARALVANGIEPTILEACPTPGGLTRTTSVGGFCFDYTGHLLHLSRYDSPAAVPFANLDDADWQRVSRRSYCYVANELITAPIQYNLYQLPQPLREACVVSYEQRTGRSSGGAAPPKNFRDFIEAGFGRKLAEIFLVPQNEKTWAISLDRLSPDAGRRFFPPPDDSLVRRGIEGPHEAGGEYNSSFWYPKVGGIQRLSDGLAKGLPPVQLLQRVVRMDLDGRKITTTSGRRFPFSAVFSSLPLKMLCALTNDAALRTWGAGLSNSATINFNFGMRGAPPPALRDAQWIYVPDPTLPFYRVGFFSNISRGVCPQDCTAMYVEVGVAGDTIFDVDIIDDLQRHVLAALSGLGWLRLDDVTCSVTHVIDCAYVHPTIETAPLTEKIIDRLKSYGVFPIGRYGLWDYTSMEDSIHSGITTVENVLECSTRS